MKLKIARSWAILILAVVFLLGLILLTYYYCQSSVIRKFTNNPTNLREINRLAKASNILFLADYFKQDGLPEYQLRVSPENLLKLKSSLPDVQQIVLVDNFSSKVPAEFIADNGTSYPVEVSYRGNGAVHWAFSKKSWRIKFLDKPFKELSSIDLIIPEDRGLVFEHLANFRAKKTGLLYPYSWFAKLSLNESSPMVYYVTEKIDEDFITRQQLKGTLFGERDDINDWNMNIYQSASNWRAYPDDPENPDFVKLQQLLDLINDPSATTAEIGALLDLDNFLRWHIHSLLMGSTHQDQSHNNRLFYNHETERFELIPWDTGQREMVSEALNPGVHPLVNRLLEDKEMVEKRNKLLLSLLKDQKFIEEDKEYFISSLETIWTPLIKDINKFYPNIKYYLDIKTYNQWMDDHFSSLIYQLKQ